MSSHCGRYPKCGCSSVIGTKCHLKDGDPMLLQKEPTFSTEVEKAKRDEADKYNVDSFGKHMKRRKPTNYTPPKKKRKK